MARFVKNHRRRTQSRKRIAPEHNGSVSRYENGCVEYRSGHVRVTFGERNGSPLVSRETPDLLCGKIVDRTSTLTVSFPGTKRNYVEVSNKLFWLKKIGYLTRYSEVSAPDGECQFTLGIASVDLSACVIGELPRWVRVTESRQQVSTKTEYKLLPTRFNKSEKTPYKPTDTTNAHDPDRTSDYDA